jgi:hypothetical protein
MQKLLHSFIEAVANTASGFILSMLAVQFIFPVVGVTMDLRQNFMATGIMTIVSVARSYAWRRIFNRLHARIG